MPMCTIQIVLVRWMNPWLFMLRKKAPVEFYQFNEHVNRRMASNPMWNITHQINHKAYGKKTFPSEPLVSTRPSNSKTDGTPDTGSR